MESDDDENLQNELFTKIRKIGEGTFAVVYEGIDIKNNKTIAIKKIKLDAKNPGIDISALRELKALKALEHPNIAKLLAVYGSGKNLNLVLEYYQSDLEKVIKDSLLTFGQADIKAWMLMILRGVEHLHQRGFLHRDLKPSNLLIGDDGVIRIADFGLCRDYAVPLEPMTSQVVTLWYRSPELLLGAKYYGGGVDVWSIGCIFAELMLRTPFLSCEGGELAQLDTIYKALGCPNDWPEMIDLPSFHHPSKNQKPPLKSIFNAASEDALDLLEGMLTYNPNKRLTTRQCLLHPYFTNYPGPTSINKLYKPNVNEYSEKRMKTTAETKGINPRKLFTE